MAEKHTPQPLPENTFPQSSATRTAYDECLTLEQRGAWNQFDSELQKEASVHIMFDVSPLVAARVLGYALVFAPSEDGRNALAREINGCYGDLELLVGLAHLYVLGLIRVFYNPKGPPPAVSVDQSPRPSFEEAVQKLEHLLLLPSIAPVQLRKLLLFRDNHRCVFTGALDSDLDSPAIFGTKFEVINVAHIISQSLSTGIHNTTERVGDKFEWARTAGAMIERFGGFSSRDVLRDEVLNSPANAFLSSPTPHTVFDRLNMWLMPAGDEHHEVIPNTYDVEYHHGNQKLPYLGSGVRPRITFSYAQVGDQTIPPPDPRIIALHAACARIAHMSGAAGWLQEFFRDSDGISVMTQPNAASELSRALRQMQVISALA